MKKKLKVALNIPDCHIPWEDEKAYDLMLDVALDVDKDIGINQINIMGDYADAFWLNGHKKSPSVFEIECTFKQEVEKVVDRLRQLRHLFPKAEIVYLEGNHEYRLIRYLVEKCPELYGLINIKELFKIDDLDIIWKPYGKLQLHRCLNTNYMLRHVPYNGGKHCAAATAHNKGISLGFGHTHRKQCYTYMDALGKERSCYSLGWLGNRTAPVFDYMDTDDWAHSFQLVYAFDVDDWFVHNVDIKEHKAVYNGVLYTP